MTKDQTRRTNSMIKKSFLYHPTSFMPRRSFSVKRFISNRQNAFSLSSVLNKKIRSRGKEGHGLRGVQHRATGMMLKLTLRNAKDCFLRGFYKIRMTFS
jgi:hypothetical protein